MTGAPRQIVRRVVRDAVGAGERSGQITLDPVAKKELETKIADAFEAGNIHEAMSLYAGQASDLRGQRILQRIMDSAMLTLGVSVSGAREAWFHELTALSERLQNGAMPSSARESPVRDAFRGISVPLSATTSDVLRRLALVKARFDQSLEFAKASEDPIASLQKLANAVPLEKLPDQSLMSLLESFADRERFQDVISIYERAPKSFQNYAGPRREYALALHLTGRDDDCRQQLTLLLRYQEADPIVAGLLGKLDKERAYTLLAAGKNDDAQAHLLQAAATYQRGFEMDRTQLYPVVNLPGVLLALGKDEEAMSFGRTILALAKLRASYGERNFFDATAALEMSALLGDANGVQFWLKRSLDAASEPWQRKSVVTALERLAEALDERGAGTAVLRAASRALAELEGSRSATPEHGAPTASAAMLSEVQKVTYRFGARHARRLTGNYQLSGIAHDVRMTPADLRFFTRIVHDEGWAQLSKPGDVSRSIDQLVRQRFGTEKMEDMKGPVHQEFDRTMPGLARFMGAKENSQTNVSADWLNGLGDCRQHAPTKMLLFEAWKRLRSGALIEALHEAHTRGRAKVASELQGELQELARYEMRVMDALIVNRSHFELIEEHTLTVLSKRKAPDATGEMRELDELRLADSFYHRVHALADGVLGVDITAQGLELTVPKPSADGRQVLLLPASYSKDRSVPSPDFGQLEFRGIQVATPGWEREVPTAGLDLSELHAYVRTAPTAKA